ncbi:MAG: M20/M25/M40 family metallo-hydrolase [Pirellulales bacterium]|nr:M20/M25/M40 family metallo-hydrolase [Pirellulales bacterium]
MGTTPLFAADNATADASAEAAVEARMTSAVGFLASDDLEGRGVGTEGLNRAAAYIAEQFAALGLKTEIFNGGPFQSFSMTTSAEMGESNQVRLLGPAASGGEAPTIELKLGEQFNPLALGGSAKFELPLVFVGYGITAPDANYDDYAGIDVKGKAVIILRHEPEQENPHSAFDGTRDSRHAPLVRKISNAYEHGAAAVVFCTDEVYLKKRVGNRRKMWLNALEKLAEAQRSEAGQAGDDLEKLAAREDKIRELADAVLNQGKRLREELDPLLKFNQGGEAAEGRDFAVLHVSRGALAPAFASIGHSLGELEQQIDEGPKPQSCELTGWRIAGEVSIVRREAEVKNVVAVLEGEGPLADETIVIGAHYDHVGRGGPASLAPGSTDIHNGADDNGSGTAALLEIARFLATRPERLKRRVVFIAFTAEEEGLIGSARYVREPAFPLEKTVAMLNMDMVGRLKDEKLTIQGTATAEEFSALIDRLNEHYGFELSKTKGGFGPSDHSSFYAKKIPVMHFFTGLHSDYHRPSDDVDRLNISGMRRITEMIEEVTVELADAPAAPKYVNTGGSESPAAGGDSDRPYFGSIPDFSQDQPGYAITGVTKDGPAEKAGLQGGDIIIKLGDSQVGGLDDFDSALRKYKPGDKVPVVVKRGTQELTLEVTLAAPR